MKKIVLILVAILFLSLLASCVPTEPKDILPFCKAQYETLLIEDPDFPPAYVGACVSNLQSGKINAFASLCGYEPFRAQLENELGITLETKKDCVDFIKNYEQ